ncbi:MAG: nitrilase-related carbon-nitrogen hydrolase [Spirochaetia bacterium]
MKIAFYQFAPEFGNTEANIETMRKALERTEADLLVTVELATSGYNFTSFEEAESLSLHTDSERFKPLRTEAAKGGKYLVFGFPEKGSDGKLYNSGMCIGPEAFQKVYRKAHVFLDEKDWASPGDTGIFSFKAGGVQIAMLICFDHIFPEAARTAALSGAQIICHPSDLVLEGKAQLTTRVRAMENRIFWIMANRYGTEDRGGKALTFTGGSQIVSPDGDVLASAEREGEMLATVEINPAKALDKHITPRNDLFSDRRPAVYRTMQQY